MRTIPLKDVFYLAMGGLGQVPDVRTPGEAQRMKLIRFLNPRLREAWEFAFWPELMLTEQRAFRDAYAAGTTYADGDQVYNAADETYYESLQDANTGNDPATETAWWSELTTMDRYVAWEQTGQTAIGTVKSVATRNWKKSDYPGYLNFSLSENGIQLGTLAPAQVWVEFRQRVPLLDGRKWEAQETYAADEVRYYEATGECYLSLQASNTGQNPTTATSYWRKLDFPWVLSGFVAQAVYADGLKEDRQQTKRQALAAAYVELSRAYETAVGQSGQTPAAEFAGY